MRILEVLTKWLMFGIIVAIAVGIGWGLGILMQGDDPVMNESAAVAWVMITIFEFIVVLILGNYIWEEVHLFRGKRPEYEPTFLYDEYRHINYDLGNAKFIKAWEDKDFYTYKHWLYKQESGKYFCLTEKWFMRAEDSWTKEFDTMEQVNNCYFPKPKVVKIGE